MTNLFEGPRTIAIEGPIRAGKSSLAALLAHKMQCRYIAEPHSNPFLERFYDGDKNVAFPAQMWFLTSRFEQLRDAGAQTSVSVGCVASVADYIFEKDKIFACLNLTDEELALYNRQFQYFRQQLRTPDLVIYLQASPRILRERIERKGVAGERNISKSYVEQVVQAYEHYFFHYTATDLLIVNTDDIDFVQNNSDLQTLLKRMTEPVRGTQYFLPLSAGGYGLRNRLRFIGSQSVGPAPRALTA